MKKTSNNVKYGGYGVIVCAIAIAVAVLINLAVSALPSRISQIDVGGKGYAKIGDTAKNVAESIRDKVTIYEITSSGSEDAILRKYLSEYSALNSNISVKTIYPASNPNFISKYTDSDVATNSLIVVNDATGRSFVVNNSDIYEKKYTQEELMNYYYYGIEPTGTTYFSADQSISTAIDYVCSERIPVVYTLTGHGETEFDSTVAEYIKTENIDYSADLNLLSAGSVPEDAGMVIINYPTKDLDESESGALLEYVKAGGNVVLLTAYDSGEMPNLYAFAASLGLKSKGGLLVEGSSSNHYPNYPHYLIPKVVQSDITDKLGSTAVNIVLPDSGALVETDELPSGVTVKSLLRSSSSAYIKKGEFETVDKEDGDETGTFMIAAMSEYKTDEGDVGRFVWYASPHIANSQLSSYSNVEYFMAMTTLLCDKENTISIAGMQMSSEALTVTETSANVWGAVLVAMIPVTVILIGVFVVMSRRSR